MRIGGMKQNILDKFKDFQFLFLFTLIGYSLYIFYEIFIFYSVVMAVLLLPETNVGIAITCIFCLLEISTDIFFIFLIIGFRVILHAAVKEKSLKYAAYTIAFSLLIVYKIIRIISLVVNIVT